MLLVVKFVCLWHNTHIATVQWLKYVLIDCHHFPYRKMAIFVIVQIAEGAKAWFGGIVINVWFPSFDVSSKRKRWVWKLDFNKKKTWDCCHAYMPNYDAKLSYDLKNWTSNSTIAKLETIITVSLAMAFTFRFSVFGWCCIISATSVLDIWPYGSSHKQKRTKKRLNGVKKYDNE